MRWLMRSKIHNATVTEANLAYVGSITIDEDLVDRVGLWPGEKVLVVSNSSCAPRDLCDRRTPRQRLYLHERRRGASDPRR